MAFRQRLAAGRLLAHRLEGLDLRPEVVLGLPPGGVPVALGVANTLAASFEVFVAQRVGLPGGGDFGIAAVAEELPEPVVSDASRLLGLDQRDLGALAGIAREELRRRVLRYRGWRQLPDLAGKRVALVDDGLGAGVTAEAALRALRRRRPGSLLLAVPVCTDETAARIAAFADEVVCLGPVPFFSAGQWYERDGPASDDDVLELLGRVAAASGA